MNFTTPTVTVIIPVRNCIAYIEEALNSVLRQSYRDLELLLVDDGSEDADYRQFEQIDSRLRVIRLESVGVSRARNTGMAQGRGLLFAFLDADDVWFPGKLEAQVRYLESHPDVGVVFGGFMRWSPDRDGVFESASSLVNDCSTAKVCDVNRSGWLYSRLLSGLLVGMNTAVIRREIYESLGGFNEAMRQGEDYDFWLKASRLQEMHALDAKVALYRIHGASAMHKISEVNYLAQLLNAAKMRWGLTGPGNVCLTEKEFDLRLGQVDFDHGYTHFWRGERKLAKQSFWLALCRGYMPWRCIAYILLSSLPISAKKKTQI